MWTLLKFAGLEKAPGVQVITFVRVEFLFGLLEGCTGDHHVKKTAA